MHSFMFRSWRKRCACVWACCARWAVSPSNQQGSDHSPWATWSSQCSGLPSMGRQHQKHLEKWNTIQKRSEGLNLASPKAANPLHLDLFDHCHSSVSLPCLGKSKVFTLIKPSRTLSNLEWEPLRENMAGSFEQGNGAVKMQFWCMMSTVDLIYCGKGRGKRKCKSEDEDETSDSLMCDAGRGGCIRDKRHCSSCCRWQFFHI